MIKPDWNIFKAKFSENPQKNFEWLCYLMFCEELDRPYGLFRYKNQSAIETEPIIQEQNVIAWQAKFYETSLSQHVQDIKETLQKLNRDYPTVNKLYIYSNQEWGQNKGKKPQGLMAIEQLASSLNVQVIWRLCSFFESKFVTKDNEIIANHFFTLEQSVISLLEEMAAHTTNIMSHVGTEIRYKGKTFEIRRAEEIEKVIISQQQAIIISGSGGAGKTAIAKMLHDKSTANSLFYVLKASEFELNRIDDLFTNCTLNDFIEICRNAQDKTIVIDSAEKLLDLINAEPFKEFLVSIYSSGWKIIFTIRDSYLKDLEYQFLEAYNIAPSVINIEPIDLNHLKQLAVQYNFILPQDYKLLELLKMPFYLNEYLEQYNDEKLTYRGFKNKLWDQTVKKGKPEREICFMEMTFRRANEGCFFVDPIESQVYICNELHRDGILGYEIAGFYISHDIYEEWALEKIIEKNYINKKSELEFFEGIGCSLPIRRCFRNWLSEKLLLEDHTIIGFIENSIQNENVETFWKDEIFVSILLSNYSETFFQSFKHELLMDEFKLLKKLMFTLRIACKELDYEFLHRLGVEEFNLWDSGYLVTRPKGAGWEAFIKFIYEKVEIINLENIGFVIPILKEWSEKNKCGITNMHCGNIALKLYHYYSSNECNTSCREEIRDTLKILSNCSLEMKDEIEDIIEQVLINQWKGHCDPYYDLCEMILQGIEGWDIVDNIPLKTLKLLELFWTRSPEKASLYDIQLDEVENQFGIDAKHAHYYPASAIQTPVLRLLKSNPKETIDFVLNFVNKCVSTYATEIKINDSDESTQVYLRIDNNEIIRQCFSHSLWQSYRGTGPLWVPDLLKSLHMALEKYLLEYAEIEPQQQLEELLLYLLKHSESCSISSVVVSIALAFPEKTFNLIKILLQTKEFVIADTHRLQQEQNAKFIYSTLDSVSYPEKMYSVERIKTCEDIHRSKSLESQCLFYQVFVASEEDREIFESRQKDIWEIIDIYYSKLPPLAEQREKDMTWRMFLYRMDRRKMEINTSVVDEGVAIEFAPTLPDDLEKFSKDSQDNYSGLMKYIELNLWASQKLEKNSQCKDYKKYEGNPQKALTEVKELLVMFETLDKDSDEKSREEFKLLYAEVPSKVCVVLLEYYLDKLNEGDRKFCKEIVIEIFKQAVFTDGIYQGGQAINNAIELLPKLIYIYQDELDEIQIMLLIAFLKVKHTGNFTAQKYNDSVIKAIHKMRESYFEIADFILIGYIVLKPKYDKIISNYSKRYGFTRPKILDYQKIIEILIMENEECLRKIMDGQLTLNNCDEVKNLDIGDLAFIFMALPNETENEEYINLRKEIINVFAKNFDKDYSDDGIDYFAKVLFMKKYADMVLKSNSEQIPMLLKPFLQNFKISENVANLLKYFILAEMKLYTENKFWIVWKEFDFELTRAQKPQHSNRDFDQVIESLFLTSILWNKDRKEWRSLKSENFKNLKETAQKLGKFPYTLYSLSKLLNGIGTPFLSEGIMCISNILSCNLELKNSTIHSDTIYFLENIMRLYIYSNRSLIKTNSEVKNKILVVLDFLIEKNSSTAYMLREYII